MIKEAPIEGLDPLDPEPFIGRFGNITVIGTNHNSIFDKNAYTLKNREILSVLKHSDHLLIEGSRLSHILLMAGLSMGTRQMSHDLLALSLFQEERKQNIHPLEDGVDLVALGERHEISRITLIGFLSTHFIKDSDAMGHLANPDEFGTMVEAYAKFFKLICPSLASMEDESLENTIGNQIVNSLNFAISSRSEQDPTNSQFVKRLNGFDIFQDYLGRIRDFNVIVPNTSRLLTELPGSKVVVIGKNHVPYIIKAISGENMEHPKPWSQHIDILPEKKREEVDVFERYAHWQPEK